MNTWLIVDLEATCWEDGLMPNGEHQSVGTMEIIEIGCAVAKENGGFLHKSKKFLRELVQRIYDNDIIKGYKIIANVIIMKERILRVLMFFALCFTIFFIIMGIVERFDFVFAGALIIAVASSIQYIIIGEWNPLHLFKKNERN